MFGKHCCTFISNNTASDSTFSVAMNKLQNLRQEFKENAG